MSRKKRFWILLAGLAAALLAALTSCTDVPYLAQCAKGQIQILAAREPIEKVLKDPATPPTVRQRLTRVLAIRDFASRDLLLPDNGSYRCYADLKRNCVVWNIVAAPEFSLQPLRWCFPVAGCVSYRGYFDREKAEKFAEGLRRAGNDVYVYGVSAYSTLGWFDDPVLNTFLNRPEPELAGLIFHELAHQKLYVKGDSAFDEAFAKTVEMEGVSRWLKKNKEEKDLPDYFARKHRADDFVALVLSTRRQLEGLYASKLSDAEKQAGKEKAFREMRRRYAQLKESWGGYAGYDRWFASGLNNAKIASISTYRSYVPAFQALLRKNHGDLAAFYREADKIARLPAARRAARMEELSPVTVVRNPAEKP
ncbi:MAG: aminopeptidase [Desulfuromonadales bacterium]